MSTMPIFQMRSNPLSPIHSSLIACNVSLQMYPLKIRSLDLLKAAIVAFLALLDWLSQNSFSLL